MRSRGGEIEGETEQREIEGEIKRQDRAARCCGQRGVRCDRRDLVRAIARLELGVHRRRRMHDLGSLSLSLSLSLCASDPEMV